jgi:hypothetical protein
MPKTVPHWESKIILKGGGTSFDGWAKLFEVDWKKFILLSSHPLLT